MSCSAREGLIVTLSKMSLDHMYTIMQSAQRLCLLYTEPLDTVNYSDIKNSTDQMADGQAVWIFIIHLLENKFILPM